MKFGITSIVELLSVDKCTWLNEPAEGGVSAAGLRVMTDRATDFWRQTLYGSGRPYERLYDQAGLMVLVDEENWIKGRLAKNAIISCILLR